METRRIPHRDARRRRALVDDVASSANLKSDGPSKPKNNKTSQTEAADSDSPPSRSYARDTLCERQPRLTDLAPRNRFVLFLWILIAGGIVAGVIALHAQLPVWTQVLPAETLAPLNLAKSGGLAGWYSSMLLAASAIGAFVTYLIRRHKADDFRGRYRLWLSASLLLMLASLDASTGLRNTLSAVLSLATGTQPLGKTELWWVAAYAMFGGYVGTRMAIDLWPCRGATFAVFLSILSYGTSLGVMLGVVAQLPPEFVVGLTRSNQVMLQAGAAMAGHVFLLWALGLNARYVRLDAEGLIPATSTAAERGKKRGKQSKSGTTNAQQEGSSPDTSDEEGASNSSKKGAKKSIRRSDLHRPKDEQDEATDQEETTTRKKTSRKADRKREKSPANPSSSESKKTDPPATEPHEEEGEQLSKSERRRLRKQKRKEQRRQAA